ncbi:hypothetical protein AHMF7605_03900 [Adhaeribacter arboris]|uniref:SWIM-type domain-containing protein n=1 Tax=Adhaeribacter arboris TaxID=2072846 RepID=A0A2T2YB37_9BACT|nr:SWIM zinc finger family protein [Adhaeribacter arboris]PSR52727.1 hypothetical protein AHMF7605_03900 [Adhaeribacter arboris]
MLTLQNFETQVSPAILQRGKQYYSDKAITWLEEIEENKWQAEVEGTAIYQVNITLINQSEIRNYRCDCPYDGNTCKHAVAVFFALLAEIKKPNREPFRAKAKKDIFQSLLQSIKLAEFQEFIRRYAAKDKNFKTEFELYFAAKDSRIDVAQKYEDLIQKLIRKHSDHGFIDYRAANSLAKEVNKLLENSQDFIQQRNFRDAFMLATVVLKAMLKVATESDDSSGNLGGTIAHAIELLETISTSAAARELKEQVFLFLQEELSHKVYFNYGDYGYNLMEVFQNLAIELNKTAVYLNFIDAQLPRLNGFYDNFRKDYFQQQKIAFLKAIGQAKEAEELIQQNLTIVEVRQGEVEKAIAKKDYKAAKILIADGIALAESKNHPGTVAAWQKELLRIAVSEKNLAAIRHFTRHFAYNRGFDITYYKQWKETFRTTEWPVVIEKYIQETTAQLMPKWESNKGNYWNSKHPPLLHYLGPVFIQEQYWDRLLALVQREQDLKTTLKYHSYLAPRYPAELLEIYLPAFEQYGQQANGRGEYTDLTAKMKKVMQDIPAGKERIQNIARNLREQFPRRPAMLEELNKILK